MASTNGKDRSGATLDVLAAHVAMHKAVLELALRDVEMGVVELDQIRHVLTLEARKKTAKELAAQGLSTRQIAAVTGTSQRTIARDIAEPDGSKSEPSGSKSVPGGAPEEPSADIDPDAKAEITDLANKFREQTATHTNRLAQAQKDFHRAARSLGQLKRLVEEAGLDWWPFYEAHFDKPRKYAEQALRLIEE